jgi:hypothetical protein
MCTYLSGKTASDFSDFMGCGTELAQQRDMPPLHVRQMMTSTLHAPHEACTLCTGKRSSAVLSDQPLEQELSPRTSAAAVKRTIPATGAL